MHGIWPMACEKCGRRLVMDTRVRFVSAINPLGQLVNAALCPGCNHLTEPKAQEGERS